MNPGRRRTTRSGHSLSRKVDCGNGVLYQLAKLGIAPREITHVFITHHHVDHNADLGYLLVAP